MYVDCYNRDDLVHVCLSIERFVKSRVVRFSCVHDHDRRVVRAHILVDQSHPSLIESLARYSLKYIAMNALCCGDEEKEKIVPTLLMQDEDCLLTKYKASKAFLDAWPRVAREFAFSVLTLTDLDESCLVLLWSKEMWTQRNLVLEPCICWAMYESFKGQQVSIELQ